MMHTTTKADAQDIRLFITACEAVIRAAKSAKPNSMIQHAAADAELGIQVAAPSYRADWICFSAQDILANLDDWCGYKARKTKEMLRQFI